MIKKLEQFQTAVELKNRWRALAAMDILMEKEIGYRMYQWQENWDQQWSFGKIDNGGGDEVVRLFDTASDACILKGFDHESDFSPYAQEVYAVYSGMYDHIPQILLKQLEDPAVEREHVTFCIWRNPAAADWQKTLSEEYDEEDGTEYLTDYFHSTINEHIEWMEDNYGIDFTKDQKEIMAAIFANSLYLQKKFKRLNLKIRQKESWLNYQKSGIP